MQNWFDVRDQVVIVTGGGGLLGRQHIRALYDAGAMPVAADVRIEAARDAVAGLESGRCAAVELDVTDRASVLAMTCEVARRFDRIDGLVNNAALDPKFDAEQTGEHGSSFEELPREVWDASLEVDLTGAFLCAQAVAPFLRHRQRGSIVNVSSIYGLVGPDQSLYESPDGPPRYKPVGYSVTKAGLIGLTRYLASYWRATGIRVNTLTLGGVRNRQDEAFIARYGARTLLGRMAEPAEYCGALIFLLSPASSYMTGSNLIVDGGWTAW